MIALNTINGGRYSYGNYQRLGNVSTRATSIKSDVMAEDGGLQQKQNGKQSNYGFGI